MCEASKFMPLVMVATRPSSWAAAPTEKPGSPRGAPHPSESRRDSTGDGPGPVNQLTAPICRILNVGRRSVQAVARQYHRPLEAATTAGDQDMWRAAQDCRATSAGLGRLPVAKTGQFNNCDRSTGRAVFRSKGDTDPRQPQPLFLPFGFQEPAREHSVPMPCNQTEHQACGP